MTGNPIDDTWAIRYFSQPDKSISTGLEILVATSFGKSMGLSGDRIGFLSGVVKDSTLIKPIITALTWGNKLVINNPPTHGAMIVYKILRNQTLYSMWTEELSQVTANIEV